MKKLEFDAHLRPSSKKYVPKSKMVSRKCKWMNKGKNKEAFFTLTCSVSKFIPGAEEYAPTGFIDFRCGQYNTFKINTRDFEAFTEAMRQALDHFEKHKEDLNKCLDLELEKYMDHQYQKLEMIKFLKNDIPK